MAVMKLLTLCLMVSLSYSRHFLPIKPGDALARRLLKKAPLRSWDSLWTHPMASSMSSKQTVKVLQEDTVIKFGNQTLPEYDDEVNATNAKFGNQMLPEDDDEDNATNASIPHEFTSNSSIPLVKPVPWNYSSWVAANLNHPYLPWGSSTCEKFETNLNDDGGGQNIYLDRHHVQCKAGQAMTGWWLNRGGTHNKIRVVYTCCYRPLSSCEDRKTNLNDDGHPKRRSIYLDRHNSDCPAGKAMTEWRVDRGGTSKKIRINYKCCGTSVGELAKPECNWQCYLDRYKDLQNAFGEDNVNAAKDHWSRHGEGENRDCTCQGLECDWQCYLDRYPDLQNAFGKTNVAEAKKHWFNHGKGEKRVCHCGLGSCQTKNTPANDWGDGNTIYMDRHEAQCGPAEVMTRWQLHRPSGHQIAIKYECCK